MGQFFGLPAATLQTLLAQYTAALSAVATRGQSYIIDGRSLSSADLGQIRQTIMEIQAAINQAAGTRRTSLYVGYRSGY